MKILILGYSDFAQRRIIPVLIKNFKYINIGIASKSKKKDNKYKEFSWFNNYAEAITLFKPDIVYISLPNSLHYQWGKFALKNKTHLIIDKPMCLKESHVENLIKLAGKNNVLVAESTIFNYHPQIEKSLKLIGGFNKIQKIQSNFCIPELEKKNIKLSEKLGGGVNHDMGPYAAGSFRFFFKKFPEKIVALSIKKNKIVKDLSIQAKYKDKISYSYLSFGKEYKNDLILFSKNKIIRINSVFSPNPSLHTFIEVKNNNKTTLIKVKPHSTFKIFFDIFLRCLKDNKLNFFNKSMLFDAKFRKIINNQIK